MYCAVVRYRTYHIWCEIDLFFTRLDYNISNSLDRGSIPLPVHILMVPAKKAALSGTVPPLHCPALRQRQLTNSINHSINQIYVHIYIYTYYIYTNTIYKRRISISVEVLNVSALTCLAQQVFRVVSAGVLAGVNCPDHSDNFFSIVILLIWITVK